jgi:hypothetical protein
MKATTAARDVNPQPPPTCLLRSEWELQRRLVDMGIDITRWGSDAHKSLHDLWQEVVQGESRIHEDAPYRSLHVTQVIIRRGDRVLIEAEQAFKRGGRRCRKRPPAEKMRPGETVISASLRCLREELGIDVSQVTLRPESYRRTIVDGEPQSYPGLRTRWHLHRIEAQVDGLPACDFVTEEAADNIHDPIGRHFWEWQPLRMISG